MILALRTGLPDEYWLKDPRRFWTAMDIEKQAANKAKGVVDSG